jgi:KaiC/GvpD/RAD55 family RecA-like ATPase
MDVERALISTALRQRNLRPIIEAGINPDFFPTVDHANAWRWIIEYWTRYGEVPTARAFKQNFPTYRLVKAEEPLDFLVDNLREQRKLAIIGTALFEVIEIEKSEHIADDLLDRIHNMLSDIGTEVSPMRDVDMVASYKERLEGYAELRNLPDGMRGIPFGFPSLDAATSGAQKGQLITLVGEPKAGKSTLLLRTAITAHASGLPVLFVGFEMGNDEQAARYDSMIGAVDHTRLLTGKLSPEAEERLRKRLRRIARNNDQPFIMSQDVSSTTTVSGLIAKVQQYRPAVVFVDGVYLMQPEGVYDNTAAALTQITRSLKRAAQTTNIPFVVTTQVLTWKFSRKKGLTGDAIGYTSSFIQDSDLVIGVEHTDVDDEKTVRVVLARNCPRMMTRIRWDWALGTFEELEGTTTYMGPLDEDDEDEPGLGDIDT